MHNNTHSTINSHISSVRPSAHPSIHPSIYPSIHLGLFIHPSLCSSIYPSLPLSLSSSPYSDLVYVILILTIYPSLYESHSYKGARLDWSSVSQSVPRNPRIPWDEPKDS